MNAVMQCDDDPRSREADTVDLRAKLKGDDGLLLCIVPYNDLAEQE